VKQRTFAAPLVIALSLAFFGLWAQGAVPDVPTGQWLPGPALAQPRAGAVSVALDDGRVLVIGGRTSQGPVNTVEVLNADGSMAVAAPMLARRAGHAAAKLPDGRVLVIGGTTLVTSDIGNGPVTSEAVTNSAEIFDAFGNVWYPAASLTIARSGHTATAVADGRVLVAGGAGQDGAALDSFEVFDVETGQFASPGLMSAPRIDHAAAVAGLTKVLVAGGRNSNGVLGTADIVDVGTGTVSSLVLNSPRADASATRLLDGTVLVAGGSNGATDLASAELIDPASGLSMPVGSMSQARSSHQALLLDHNNTVLVTGGTSNGAVVASAEQFVPWSGQFLAAGSPAVARGAAAVSNLSKDGVAWLATGRAADNTLVVASEFFGFATLKTDKDDYPPGSTVVISGSGWQPGERVTMVLHEVGTGHADRSYFAIADAAGRITNTEFMTDASHIGVRFYLTARGAASQAQVTFTDALNTNTALTSSVNPSSSGQSVTFTATVTYTQAGSGHQVGDPVTQGSVVFGENGNANCGGGGFILHQAAQTPDSNGQVTFTISSLGSGDHTIRACYSGTGGSSGTNNSANVLTQTVNTCTAPSVTTHPAAQSIVYGANASFTAAASGSPAPGAQWQVSTNGGGSWADLPGQTATTLTLTKPTVAMSGNLYRVVFTNTCTPSTATSSAALLTVSPKTLTITGAAAQSKVYDGTTAATVSFSGASLVGIESGDVVTINSAGYSATFNNKTVGNAKPVTVTGVTLSGAAAGNYTVSQPSGLTANITAKNLTITGAVAQNKTYNGTTAAVVDFSGAALNGVVGSDALAINSAGYSASFADKNVGTWAVTVTGVTLGGADANNYTVSQPTGLTAQILPKNLMITGAVAQNKTYDGTTAAVVDFSSATLNGVVGSEVVTINAAGYSASFADKNVGTWGVSVTGVMLGGANAANYTVSQPSGLMAQILARNLTITGVVGQNKSYDGTTTAAVDFSAATLSGVVGTEVVTINDGSYSASFADQNVGNWAVTVTGVTLGGANAANYTVSQPSALTANITAKNLTISGAVAQDKTYDGTTSATVDFNTATLNGIVGSEVVTINSAGYSASFANKNAGTWAVTVTGVTLGGAAAGNYTVSQPSGLTAQILAKNLTIAGAVAQNKTYDGTMAATVDFSNAALTGVVGSEVVTINAGGYSASFADKNIGTWAVTVTGVTLAGVDAGNYTVSQPAGLSAEILAKNLTITGAVTQDKTYDATTAATVGFSTATLNGVVGAENVSINSAGYSASFADKNIGTWAVTVTGVTLAGVDAGNYTVSQPAGLTAEILAKNLTISGTVAQDKTYDGTTAATVAFTTATLNGVVSGETVTIDTSGYSASFADKNIGTWAVTVTGVTLAGADAGNYTVSQPSGLTAQILANNLTISGAVAHDKTYDGTMAATVAFTAATLNGVVGSEVVTINAGGYSASFADKNVGGNKPVTVIGVALSGADASNYTVSQPSGLKANISHRSLTVSASGIDKVYDGNNAATVTLSDDRVSGDVLTASHTTATFVNKNVGNGKTVSVSGISIAGADAGNYALANPTASTSANISARNLTVTASASNKVYDGTTAASVTLADDRVLDDMLVITFASSTFSDKNAASGKTVTVNGISVAGADAGNYLANTSTTATANITPAPLTIVAVDKSITFGAPSPTFTVTYAGFVAGEASSVLSGTTTYTFEGVAPTSYGPSTTVPTAVGTYKNTPGGVTSTNYAIGFTPGSYAIGAWTLTGFYQPVTMGGVYNTVKGGSTVPLKFNIYQGAQGTNERTDVAAIKSFQYGQTGCGVGVPEDPVDVVTTGGTTLRYDTTAHQFIQNWQTPKQANNCYAVVMTTQDGSTLVAYVKTR
jgi:YDG domain/MBG domain (YGX type)/Galactose oxidase, central domain